MDRNPVPGSNPAAWVVTGLRGFAESVQSVVPAGFPAYARVLHPARRAGRPVRWAEVAAANQRRASRAMQFCALTGSHEPGGSGRPGVFDEPPRAGELPPAEAAVLVAVLGNHTTTAERCWFAVWDGWGGLAGWIRRAAVVAAPGRRYHLLPGPIEAALAWEQPASLWWPEDRAWCVATEVDLDSTYVGASRACVSELIGHPALECLPAQPDDGVSYDADPYNPPAAHQG